MPPVDPGTLLELIEARRRDDVADLVHRVCTDDGVDAAVGLLAAVQAEVGARWQSQRWTVADEHAASAIVDHALTVAGGAVTTRPGARRVVVACVEEEWHVLPARMLSEQLRDRGWEPVFLGASSPAGQLGAFARRAAPVAVALSCSMAIHLPGARRSVEACHDAGVPVVVGGSAFPTGARARAVGADAWSASVDEVHDLLGAWADAPPAPQAATVAPPPPIDVAERHRILDAAMAVLVERISPLADAPAHERVRLRDNLDALLASAEAAAHVDDATIVVEQARWLRSVSVARGEPDGLAGVGLDALTRVVPEHLGLRGQLAVEL